MKRILAVTLAMLLSFGVMLSASAATVPPRTTAGTVYVASRAVPKAAVEFVRDWFSNRMPAQDICDQTELTVDEVKKVRICPAFTVEPFETENMQGYFFPLIYEDTFIGTLIVRRLEVPGYTGYSCNIFSDGSGDPCSKALNTISSSKSAPMMLVVTKNGYFALDSKNKAALIQNFTPPGSEKEIAKQKRGIPKMERPSRVVAISADTAYPEQISSEQLVDETVLLTVKNNSTGITYTSNNGGKIWGSVWSNGKPPVYVSIDVPSFLRKNQKVPYTVHNRTGKEIYTDEYFTLQKWNGQEWGPCPKTDGMAFKDIALSIKPKGTAALEADWGMAGIKLEAGRYKLIKKVSADNQQFTCEAVFCLVD